MIQRRPGTIPATGLPGRATIVSMLALLLGILTSFPLVAHATYALAQDPPAKQLSPEEQKAIERQHVEAEAAKWTPLEVDDLEKAIRFWIDEDGRLAAQTSITPVQGAVRIVHPALPGVARLSVNDMQALGDTTTGRNLSFTYQDYTQPGTLVAYTHVNGIAGRLIVARDGESEESNFQVELIQDPVGAAPEPGTEPVRLRVAITSKSEEPAAQRGNVNFTLGAKTFIELRQRYPREVETYLRPILRDLRQDHKVFAVDERVAWQVLGAAHEPDARAAEQVKAVLAQFDSEDFREREAALGELKKLGQPAALVLARTDRTNFSQDQNAGVDEFLAEYLTLSKDDVARLKSSPDFLLDTLASENPTLRKLALAQLKQVTSVTVNFDPDAAPDVRAAQLQKLRTALGPAGPSKQPEPEKPRP